MTFNHAEYMKAWRKRNPEKVNEYQRRYYKKHPETVQLAQLRSLAKKLGYKLVKIEEET